MKRFVVALLVLGLSFAAQSVQAQKSMTASGTVKSVSATALTITTAGKAGKDMTFTIDTSTKFVGKGLGTKGATGKLTATDAVGMNDKVSVTYHSMSGSMHAASVRVNTKAAPTKSK